jgi:hypothetical protein
MTLQFLPPPEPRPVETWTHLYRVSFWQQQTPPPGSHVRPEDAGWSEEYWDISAEDVHEVIAWADEKAGSERTYTLYIRLDDDGRWADQSFFIQIAGANPTRNPTFSDGFERKHPTRASGTSHVASD